MSNLFEDLKSSSNLITGHINPDGDALGSALAFKLILDSKGVHAAVSFDMKGNVPSNLKLFTSFIENFNFISFIFTQYKLNLWLGFISK